MSSSQIELRAHNVTLACLACGAQVTLEGPWHRRNITLWTRAHRRVMLAGWTVTAAWEHANTVVVPVPPLVAVRP